MFYSQAPKRKVLEEKVLSSLPLRRCFCLERGEIRALPERLPGWGKKQRLIGQKELVKTAITLENSMCIAVLSCLKQDIPWTKRVGKICGNS